MNLKNLARKWIHSLGFMPQSPALGGSPGVFRGWFGGSRYDYTQEAGELWSNSVVSICINRKATMMADCRLVIERYNEPKDKWERAKGPAVNQALAIFRKPNPYYNFTALINAIALSADCRGQYFLYIRRDNAGRPIGFWYLPHTWVNVESNVDNPGGEKLITHFRYTIPGAGQVMLAYDDVLMVRNGIDTKDTRCGLSPLYAQLREVSSDNEASNWLASLLRNGATPSVFMTPKVPTGGGQAPSIEQMRQTRDLANESIRDARGQAVLMPIPMDLTPGTFNPKDMELGKIRAIPTDRICAALGGDPMAFGLPSESKTYSNLEQALDALGNMTVLPTLKDWAAQWSEKMLPAFGMDPEIYRYAWDTSEVSWLADETRERDENVRANFESGIIDRFRAKEEIGETPDATDKGVTYFMLQASAQPATEPAPPKKQGLSNWAIRMGAANQARLQNLGRKPGVIVHKVTTDTAAQSAHNRLITQMDRKMAAAMDQYKAGKISGGDLQSILSDIVYQTHRKQYELGYKTAGTDPAAAQLDDFARTVTDVQQEYLHNFVQDIEDGRYNDEAGNLDVDGALAQRSRMYADNTSASASAGFIEGSSSDEEFGWQLGPVEHCEDCLYIATLSPFDKSTIFTNPREGDTRCLTNCKCSWVRLSDGLKPFGPIS
jgi:HK97 family phage portal protein